MIVKINKKENFLPRKYRRVFRQQKKRHCKSIGTKYFDLYFFTVEIYDEKTWEMHSKQYMDYVAKRIRISWKYEGLNSPHSNIEKEWDTPEENEAWKNL